MESSKNMKSIPRCALVDEMLEAPGILRRFDPAVAGEWEQKAREKGNLFIAGEGSSRILPAGNMIDLALRKGRDLRICAGGARQAAEYDLEGFFIVGASNSGRTRELVGLFETLRRSGKDCFAVTANGESPLAQAATDCKVLGCGRENAVPATKSVVETALLCQALLGKDWAHQALAADLCEETLEREAPPEIVETLAGSSVIYFAGRNDGVAEELALKACEIARKKSVYLEGTYVLHGVEEVMRAGETVLLIEPYAEEIGRYRKVLAEGVGMNVIAIASFDTPFPTLKVPRAEGFNAYIRLMAGWNILAAAGIASGADIDRPSRARKIGNEV